MPSPKATLSPLPFQLLCSFGMNEPSGFPVGFLIPYGLGAGRTQWGRTPKSSGVRRLGPWLVGCPLSCCLHLYVVPQPKLTAAGLPVTSAHLLSSQVGSPSCIKALTTLCLTLPHPKMSFLTLGPHPAQVLLLGAPDLSWTCCKCISSE